MRIQPTLISLCALAAVAAAQSPDGAAARPTAKDPRVLLEYASFDPAVALPRIPASLTAGPDVRLHIVQFVSTPTDADRDAVRLAGGAIRGYLPEDCHLVEIDGGGQSLRALEGVRWVGPYQPAYRLEPALLKELAQGQVPQRRYNLVMADKHNHKDVLAAKLAAIGAEVVDRHEGGLLFTAALDAAQLLRAARLDEVLWIDRWSPAEIDMDNARIQGGADHIEAVAGYTGSGVRGHIYEGVEAAHPDFTLALTPSNSANTPASHGHCTAGIVFGNGSSAPQARGLAPDAVGFFTNYNGVLGGLSRNQVIDDVVNVDQCMFTTASWGNARTVNYTSISADADDIVFDHRIPWTQSQSNAGDQMSRPQAWAKNVISVGGVRHYNDSTGANDSWLAGNGSTGPAQDTRNKPDLCAYYDQVWCSDRSGTAGYNSSAGVFGNSTQAFSGTSAATPIVAGHNALAIQMYTDHLFDNQPAAPGGSRFANRPLAQTLKALQIACADMYAPTATDNRREHVGWGFPNVQTMYDHRHKISIVPEDEPIAQGDTRTYSYDVAPGESIVKFVMTYVDPAGNPAAAFDRVNDLSMKVTSPNGLVYYGNYGLDGAGQTNQSNAALFSSAYDTRDTVECVVRNNPAPGRWTVTIVAPTVTVDANPSTTATDATFALVVNGGRQIIGSGCASYLPNSSPTASSKNFYPWGGYTPAELETDFASNNGGAVGGAVYFDVTVTEPVWIHSLSVNTSATLGTSLLCDVYTSASSYAGAETTPSAWTPRSAGRGVAAGTNAASKIDLAAPFRLEAGTHGFLIHANNWSHRYTNGANSYSDSTLSLDLGTATNALHSGSVFSPRTANVRVHYREADKTAQNMLYQTVLRSDELGGPGVITGLAFAAAADGNHFNSSLKIRLAHRPAGYALSPMFATNISGGALCLDSPLHSFDYRADDWANIGLQSSFAYDGVSDVVVEILARGNVQTTTGPGAGGFYSDPNRSRVVAYNWDQTVPSSGVSFADKALRMRVEFGCANANGHGASCGPLEADYWGSSALGATFHFEVEGATPNFFAVLGLGTTTAAPYPIDLNVLGWTNCTAFTPSITSLNVATGASGAASYALSVPNTPMVTGARVYGQWLNLDTSEPGNLTFSGLTRITCGSDL